MRERDQLVGGAQLDVVSKATIHQGAHSVKHWCFPLASLKLLFCFCCATSSRREGTFSQALSPAHGPGSPQETPVFITLLCSPV